MPDDKRRQKRLAGYLALAPTLKASPSGAWRFAGALVFLVGPAEARKAVKAAFAGSGLGDELPLEEPPDPARGHSAKISEAFLALAEPLLRLLSERAPLPAYQAALEIAAAV